MIIGDISALKKLETYSVQAGVNECIRRYLMYTKAGRHFLFRVGWNW